jgi:tetratricopeptide (TPR) repeat protein
VTEVSGKRFGIIGPLAAFPRRIAAREVERRNGLMRRGVTRRTSHVVFGRGLLEKASPQEIESRLDAELQAGRRVLSENGFLRLLGLLEVPTAPAMAREALLEQSRLSPRDLTLLSLFDAFEHDREPYSFRDLILSRKYAGLIAGGANWNAIAKSIHRSGPVASLTALSLHTEGAGAIYARHDRGLSELDGQILLPLPREEDAELEDLFVLADAFEHEGRYAEAAALYQRCLSLDPSDSVAAFNRANCLRATGELDEAAHAYMLAIKLDAGFVEAWFNFAALMTERGQVDAARRYLKKAIAFDHDYADAVYNLATLEYDAGNLGEARRWWVRYLELDDQSEWARKAIRGVHYIDLQLKQKTAG